MSTRPVEDNSPAWNRHAVAVFKGLYDSKIETGEDYDTRPLATFFSMVPWSKAKAAGPAFVPSLYRDFDAREHAAQRERGSYVALTGDIDSGDHEQNAVMEAVQAFCGGAAWLVYSSPHARPADRRWRIIVPLAEAHPFDAWHDAQLAFFAFMEGRGFAMDYALARAAQPVFLPNVPLEHAKTGTPLRDEEGRPLHYTTISSGTDKPGLSIDAGAVAGGIAAIRQRRAEDERIRDQIRKEAEARRASKLRGDGASLMEDFNAANSVASMLEICGYEQSTHNPEDWRSPHQTGETFATRVVGSKWISLSASDTTAGVGEKCKSGCFGDAYDLYVHYKHGGDHKAAYRALGQERRDANVIYFPQAEPPDWMSEAPPYDVEPEWLSAEHTPEINVEATEQPEQATLLPIVDISQWLGKSPPERLFAWGDMIPLNTTTMLTGPGGVGKSLFEQMLCTCIALGVPFLGIETRQMNTLYVTCEDDADELWRRQAGICAALGVPFEAIIGKLHLVSLCGDDGTALATFDENEQIVITERWRQLVRTCEQMQIQLYAFDNATDAMAGDLNSIHQVAEFVNLMTGLAIRMQGAAMILHHPNKAGDDWLGSVAWHNKVRARLIIKRSEIDGDDDGRVLENPKANYGPSGGKVTFRWFKGAFVTDADLPPETAKELTETIQATGDNKIFLACLYERNRQRRHVSESVYGQNYAPKVFAAMPESKRIGRDRLERAMDRLFRTNTIERGYLWVRKGEGVGVHGLKQTGKPVPDAGPQGSENLSEKAEKVAENLPKTSPKSFRKHTENPPKSSENTHPIDTTYLSTAPPLGAGRHEEGEDDDFDRWLR